MLHNTKNPAPNFDKQYLDILYQNKNKDYGGYELRKNYTTRLGRSVLTACAVIALLLVSVVFHNADADNIVTTKPIYSGHKITEIRIIKPRVNNPVKVNREQPKQLIKPPITARFKNPNIRTARVNIVTTMNPATTTTPIQPAILPSGGTNTGTTNITKTSGPSGNLPSGGENGTTTTINTTAAIGTAIKGATQVDQVPLYPGGEAALNAFLSKNLEYPDEAKQKNAEASIEILFVVDVDGSIQQISCNDKETFGFVKEGKRVVGLMPNWKPAIVSGKPVKCYFSVPITYILKDDDE